MPYALLSLHFAMCVCCACLCVCTIVQITQYTINFRIIAVFERCVLTSKHHTTFYCSPFPSPNGAIRHIQRTASPPLRLYVPLCSLPTSRNKYIWLTFLKQPMQHYIALSTLLHAVVAHTYHQVSQQSISLFSSYCTICFHLYQLLTTLCYLDLEPVLLTLLTYRALHM